MPAMPDDLFSFIPELLTEFLASQADPVGGGHPMKYLDRSAVKNWKVMNVPPRPESDNAPLRYHHKLLAREDTLKQFIPVGILRLNINSNQGLCQILRNHYEENMMHVPGGCLRYHTFNVDIAIFQRTLKVMSALILMNI